MKHIYPMYKMCRLVLEKQNEWQWNEITTDIYMRSSGELPNDKDVFLERDARIANGDKVYFEKGKLKSEYIKKYHTEHTKPSNAFGSIIKIDWTQPNAKDLRANITDIISNCLDKKYGFLEENSDFPQLVRLTGEGKSFANGPYLFGLSIGLMRIYATELGQLWYVVINILLLVINLLLWVAIFVANNMQNLLDNILSKFNM